MHRWVPNFPNRQYVQQGNRWVSHEKRVVNKKQPHHQWKTVTWWYPHQKNHENHPKQRKKMQILRQRFVNCLQRQPNQGRRKQILPWVSRLVFFYSSVTGVIDPPPPSAHSLPPSSPHLSAHPSYLICIPPPDIVLL